MTALKNDTLIKALLRQPTDYTPVWIMRQAGRYLPEYRATREQAGDFMSLCRNAELACEVTMQPLRRFDLDAAILFSDILTIPDAMGLGLYFTPGEGPKFERTTRTIADIKALKMPDMQDDLGYVMNAVSTIRKELDGRVPLIGFSGSPWTLATYMVEGQSTRSFEVIKTLILNEPSTAHSLLSVLAESVIAYMNAQIQSGAQVAMIFDTWGGVLSPAMYREFSLRYLQQIVEGIDRQKDGQKIPVVLFTKGAGQNLTDMSQTGCDALGVDWTIDLSQARELTGGRVALQGNLDPSTLFADPEAIRAAVRRTLDSYGEGPGHAFNLGHGITPGVNPDHLGVLVDEVHRYSRSTRAD